ncbi:MAG: hypothetical protein ABII71_01345 [Candidatus Micrarchaeota archaeon]
MEVVSTKPVSVLQVKEELTKRNEGGELGYEQAQALEHADNTVTLTPAKHEKLVEELKKIDGMTEEAALKVGDVMPKHVSTLKALLMKEKIELSDGDLENVIKLTNK